MTKAEYGISYNPELEKEFLPSPKFEGIYWQGFAEEESLTGQEINIDGVRWKIDVIGFQGSEGPGNVQLHEEPMQQEDVFFLTGSGSMTRWDGLDCILSVISDTPLMPNLTTKELSTAKFTLAVASYVSEWAPNIQREHLVLNIETGDRNMAVEPVSTPKGHYHATHLTEPSTYFVVKRSKI